MASKHLAEGYRAAEPFQQQDEWEWEDLLATACATLVRMPPASMSSISVTGNLKGVAGEGLRLLAMSKRLAIEYGLKEAIRIDGMSFTVRFNRRDGAPSIVRGSK